MSQILYIMLSASPNLPLEILYLILDHTSTNALKNVAVTSKLLSAASQARIYHTIIIKDLPSKFLLTFSKHPKATRGSIGSRVKSLVVIWEFGDGTHKIIQEHCNLLRDFLRTCGDMTSLVLHIPDPIPGSGSSWKPLILSGHWVPKLKRVTLFAVNAEDIKQLMSEKISLLSLDFSYSINRTPLSLLSTSTSLVELSVFALPDDSTATGLLFQIPSLRILGIDLGSEPSSEPDLLNQWARDISTVDIGLRGKITELRLAFPSWTEPNATLNFLALFPRLTVLSLTRAYYFYFWVVSRNIPARFCLHTQI